MMQSGTPDNAATAFDREVDLLVVGAGPAGMAAALYARLEGLDVLLVEKSGQIGGTASTSAGTLWIPGNTQSRDAGYADDPADAAQYLDSLISTADSRNLRMRRAYLETGPKAIDFLEANTDVKFAACGKHPDYHDRLGSAVSGRAIVPQIFDGRLLGPDFERVRPPIPEFMILGGMMVGKLDIPRLLGRYQSIGNFIHAGKLFLRYLADRLRFSRGTRLTMGNALVARMFYSLKRFGISVQFDTSLENLLSRDERVEGALLSMPDGPLRVRARCGVVLATGGFAHAEEYRQRFMPPPFPRYSLAAASNTGDGMRIAERLGARIAPEDNGKGGFWTPVSVTRRADGSSGLFPHLSLDRAKPGLIAVNKAGCRFVNEANSYHDFVEAMFDDKAAIPAWLICDTGFIQKYGLGCIHPGTTDLSNFEASGYLQTAENAADLAAKIGVDDKNLVESIRRNNAYAETGVDRDFGKGETELNRFNGDPMVKPNPCLGPIGDGALHAVEVWPAEIACSIGLSTDEDARVLTTNGEPIPGLFACGNDMASVMANSYPGPGTTLGPAVVFAYRAVQAAKRGRNLLSGP